MHRILWAAMAVAALTGCSGIVAEPEAQSVVGVEYAPGLYADVGVPAGDGRRPGVLLVHGGGFTFGTRQDMAGYAQALVERGVVAATIDYRLSRGRWFPTDKFTNAALREAAAKARDDATAAVAWLRANAEQFRLDPDRIAVAGYSAGGITAIEVATHDAPVVGAVAIAGAGMELDQVDAGDPPLLLLHGTADEIVGFNLAAATCEAATAVGAPCELRPFDGVNHSIGGTLLPEMVDAIDTFVRTAPAVGS